MNGITNGETIKAWITRYALSAGVKLVHARVSGNMIIFQTDGGHTDFAHDNDWHRTPESALRRAEEMRSKKIESLKKSIARIEAIEFVVPTNDGV